MIQPYLSDDLLDYVMAEIEFRTGLGETFESAMKATRLALIDAVDVACVVSGLLRDQERMRLREEVAVG
jgi:hypothetical protein